MDAEHLPGPGLDFVAREPLIHQGQGALGRIAEDDADPVEADLCLRHQRRPGRRRNRRSRMIATRTIATPTSKPRAMLTWLSARSVGRPNPDRKRGGEG